MTTSRTLAALILASTLSLACGGGGGGGGGQGAASNSNLDEGAFAASEFSYTDPHPVEFHPLGVESSVLTSRDELMIINVPEDPATARATMFDDIGVGAPVIDEVANLIGASSFRSGASGNIDDDADEELMMVRLFGSSVWVDVVERDAGGAYVTTGGFSVPSAGFIYREARLTLGDVDGDHRDELLLFAKSNHHDETTDDLWVRVYDDATQGFALLHEVNWPFPVWIDDIGDVRATAADLDGDGKEELALLTRRGGSFSSELYVRVLDDAGASFAQLVGWTKIKVILGSETGCRLLAGEFDGDGEVELVVATWTYGTDYLATVRTLEMSGNSLEEVGVEQIGGSIPVGGFGIGFQTYRSWDAVAYDVDADGELEVAMIIPGGTFTDGQLRTFRWDGAGWQSDVSTPLPGFRLEDGISLVETDDDADGQDELYMTGMSGSSGSSTKARLVYRVDYGDPSGPITNTFTSTAQSSGRAYPAVQVAGDFDSDGLAVRYTGRKFTSLSDPKPIAVLAAAPTKAGINQEYGLTSTRYTVETGSSQSYEVTTGITASVYSGSSVSDVFDLFGASARQTVRYAFNTSESVTQTESIVQGFTGPHDANTIVFEGTLYQSYEYEIVAAPDPAQVGAFLTFDVPVESRVYRWSTDYYNANVAPNLRIGSDVLPHTIGDPSTYPSFSEIETSTDKYVGWRTSNAPPATVGQAGFASTLGIKLATESATTTERTFAVDWEVGFKVGGSDFGGSFGLTDTRAYTVVIGQTTEYEGNVGDIPIEDEYEQWRYEFGLAVYHRGLLANSSNEPVGNEPGVLPYQVVTFWTTPKGTAY